MSPRKAPRHTEDPLIGKHVRVASEYVNSFGAPGSWPGEEGVITRRNDDGTYYVEYDDGGENLAMDKFTVLQQTADGTQEAPSSQLVLADPALAIQSLTNPRTGKGLELDSLLKLAASIKAQGLTTPILVRLLPGSRLEETYWEPVIPGDDTLFQRVPRKVRPIYEIVAGERRWRACMLAGLTVMPMFLRVLTDEEAETLQLVENVQREDLHPLEEALGYERLMRPTGTRTKALTVEEVHEMTGMGVSHIWKTLKLCELTEDCRAAFREGRLNRNTALHVARYLPALQSEVLADIEAMRGEDGRPASVRTVRKMLEERYKLLLADAVFDLADEQLVPAAGSCAACPKRTVNQAALFGDEPGGPDSCLDPDCFAAKKTAHVVVIRAKAAADGYKVIDEEEARAARPHDIGKAIKGYERLDAVAYIEKGNDGKEREVTFGDALRAMGKEAPKPRMFIDPHTLVPCLVITSNLADKLLPANEPPVADADDTPPAAAAPAAPAVTPEAAWPVPTKPGKAATPAKPAAQQADMLVVEDKTPADIKALRNPHVRRALLLRAFDVIRGRERTLRELQLIARAVFFNQTDVTTLHVEEYMGWQDKLIDRDDDEVAVMMVEQFDSMPADQLGQVITMAALETVIVGGFADYPDQVKLLEGYGIDVLAVRDKVSADLAREEEARDGAGAAAAGEAEAAESEAA